MDDGRERRKAKRVIVGLDVEVECRGALRVARVLDLSVGGALIECAGFDWPPPGHEMKVCISLEGRSLPLKANLVRTVIPNKAAVAFADVSGNVENVLARFVQDQDRKALRAHLHLRG